MESSLEPPTPHSLPPAETMHRAFYASDAQFDGIFYTGVRSTRIFCRPSCRARKPKPTNIEFFATPSDAMYAGYRACRRCKPMDRNNERPPLVDLLTQLIEDDPAQRLRESDLRERGIDPSTARRQFQRYFGMSFHAYARARRVGAALTSVRKPTRSTVIAQQVEAGFESASGYREAVIRLFGAPPSEASKVRVLHARWLDTPLGAMLAVADDAGLHVLDFVNRRGLEHAIERLRKRLRAVILPGEHAVLAQTTREIAEYYAGTRRAFTIPLADNGTAFQRAVWESLCRIPAGETRSYAGIAQSLGQSTAVRAVARANGDNFRAIVIPCHRVIGSDGALTGYGGGLARKQWLLDFEKSTR